MGGVSALVVAASEFVCRILARFCSVVHIISGHLQLYAKRNICSLQPLPEDFHNWETKKCQTNSAIQTYART